nr:hypothetical protein GCM10025699_18660 [Microbacterium flavescens]
MERDDFISGASAASSHMIHGGIRYLENGEFRLVHEAVTERNALLRIAPHYVRPLQTTIPIFSTFSGVLSAPLRFLRHGGGKHTERGAALIKIGLVIYDSFSRGGGRVPRHAFRGRKRSLQELPALNPDVKYTATYWDASLHDPERLAIDVLRDGRRAGGDQARAANYTAAVGAEGGRVVLRDMVSGEELGFAASVVINASGPWTDLTNLALGDPTHYMGGTKGSHIVLDHPELLAATGGGSCSSRTPTAASCSSTRSRAACSSAPPTSSTAWATRSSAPRRRSTTSSTSSGRCCPASASTDRRSCTGSRACARFPGTAISPRGSSRATTASRRLRSWEDATVLSLVGGKWTTFRASAEHLADRALALLARPRRRSTKGVAIGGGNGFPTTERARQQWIAGHADGLPAARVATLLDRYGTVATDLVAAIAEDPDDAPLVHLPGYSSAEVRHLALSEDVVHLDDLLMRRTSIAFVGGASEAAVTEIAALVAPVLGWDAGRTASEVERGVAMVHAADPSWAEASATSR